MGTHPSNVRIAPQNIRQFLDLTERATDGGTACHRHPELFYSYNRQDIVAAKNMCKTSGPGGKPCPIIVECLRFAIDAKQDDGVWGGMEEEERTALRRREKKARERKAQRELEEAAALAAGQDTLPIPIIEISASTNSARRRHLVPRQMRA